MTAPALALVPVLIDDTGTSANAASTLHDQLLDRASQPGYQQWLAATASAGGCVRPIRLRGTARDVDTATGEILRTLDTATVPDGVIYTACGTAARRSARRAPTPTAATLTSLSALDSPEVRVSQSRSRRTPPCSLPSRPPRSGPCTPDR